MDLNRKYSDHQQQVHRASTARNHSERGRHLVLAATIAREIAGFQGGLGAAAACAWSAAGRKA